MNCKFDNIILQTERISFSCWKEDDLPLAEALWGDPRVTRFICASGVFSQKEIENRLAFEIECRAKHGVQYWPFFSNTDGTLIGCCGLHPHGEDCYELGFHLRPMYWRQGYAVEAANAVIAYAFDVLHAGSLFAGHNPDNTASESVLRKLGFTYTGDEYYPPTGLNHPSYILENTLKGDGGHGIIR